MPNWCQNRLVVEGSEAAVEAFRKANSTTDTALTFQAAVPRPESEEGNWYSWNCDNWGTKWDAVDVNFDDDLWYPVDSKLDWTVYKFDTAWSPPIPWFRSLNCWTELRLILFYAEVGQSFSGSCEWDKGGSFENGESLSLGDLLALDFSNRF